MRRRIGFALIGLFLLVAGLSAFGTIPFALPAAIVLFAIGLILTSWGEHGAPRWIAWSVVGYVALLGVLFVATSPITIGREGEYWVNKDPPELLVSALALVSQAFPFVLAGSVVAVAWSDSTRTGRAFLLGGVALLAGLVALELWQAFGSAPGAETDLARYADWARYLFAGGFGALVVGAGLLAAGWDA